MPTYSLTLLVIRAADLGRAERFYNALGLSFTREKHGDGPEHLAADVGGAAFEVYPQGDSPGTAGVRLGFKVDALEEAVSAAEAAGGRVVTPPGPNPWGTGLRAVVADPDGHRVELTD